MTIDAAFYQALFPVIIIGVLATFIYESAMADRRDQAKVCRCKHLKGDHVKVRDWDSSAWVPGAEFKPGQCRKCKSCKGFQKSLS